jgi:hypothetical protein
LFSQTSGGFPKTTRNTTLGSSVSQRKSKVYSMTKLMKTDRQASGVEKNLIRNSSPAKTNLEKLNEKKNEVHHETLIEEPITLSRGK